MKRSNPYKAVIPIVSGIAYVPNPRQLEGGPVEVTVRSERIGSQGRDLAPGVRLISQISRTEKEVWVTHGEQRLFVYVEDDQGRGSYFYQSFAGTGGKQQGFWFPSGGVMADQRGRGAWVIKGNPKTDPGAGRVPLLELVEKANVILPHSDADTNIFVKRLTGVGLDEDFDYKDEYEVKPTIRITEPGNANELQKKWGSWSYQFWAHNALDKTFGKRTFNLPKSNPTDLAGRHIPERYLAGLPKKLQEQRVRELTYSRDAYRRGDYSELPTDEVARKMGLVKESAYTTVAKRRGIEYTGGFGNMAMRVLRFYGGRNASREEIERLSGALSASFKKGLAAWKSGGHRPGATAQNWAVARVNSLVVGGKTAWTADKKQFASMDEAIRGAITSKLSDVVDALRKQGRQNDVQFLSERTMAKRNPITHPAEQKAVWSVFYANRQGMDVQKKLRSTANQAVKELKLDAGLAEDLVQDAMAAAVKRVITAPEVNSADFVLSSPDLWLGYMYSLGAHHIRLKAYELAEATKAPKQAHRNLATLKGLRAEHKKLYGRAPTYAELARSTSMTPEQIRRLESAGRPPVLLDIAVVPEEQVQRVLDREAAPDPLQTIILFEDEEFRRKTLYGALKYLTPLEITLVEMIRGDEVPDWRSLGLTSEKARAIRQNIMRRVKTVMETSVQTEIADQKVKMLAEDLKSALAVGTPAENVRSLKIELNEAKEELSGFQNLLEDIAKDREVRRQIQEQREKVLVRRNRR